MPHFSSHKVFQEIPFGSGNIEKHVQLASAWDPVHGYPGYPHLKLNLGKPTKTAGFDHKWTAPQLKHKDATQLKIDRSYGPFIQH